MASSCSRELAAFAVGLRLDTVPAELVQSTRLRILDTLGVCLASCGMDYAEAILAVVREQGGRPEATLFGRTGRAPAAWAVLHNAALAHGNDFDDTHGVSGIHPSGIIVPTVLALGERMHASGAAALVAAVAAYEVALRIGKATPGALHRRGFHPTGVYGIFGAVVAAGRLLGLDGDGLTHAIGIAASQAAGSMEFLSDGSWTKRLHPGWAAHAGVVAALLAARGYTGPATALEGRFGVFNLYAAPAPPDVDGLTAGLGTEWEALNVDFKPYPCGHLSHAYMDCARTLRARHALSPDDIAAIELHVAPGAVPIVCEPLPDKRRPRSAYAAQFSLPYAVAVALALDRAGIDDFSEQRIHDTRILALAARTTYVVDDTLPFPGDFPGRVTLRVRDGRVVEARMDSARGSRDNPVSEAEVREKFTSNAGRVAPQAQVSRIAEAVQRFESIADVGTFTRLLTRDTRAASPASEAKAGRRPGRETARNRRKDREG